MLPHPIRTITPLKPPHRLPLEIILKFPAKSEETKEEDEFDDWEDEDKNLNILIIFFYFS